MTTSWDKQKKLHYELSNVGLRAQATAVGLVQLCMELKRARVLDEAAMDRIKGAIVDEVTLSVPRSIPLADYRRDMRRRLDRLFAGEEEVGPASTLPAAAADDLEI